jgi:hypothetical protein
MNLYANCCNEEEKTMYRKSNPWVSLAALLLLALVLVFVCTGCTSRAEAAETKPAPRFTVEYLPNGLRLITDTETGVQYLAYSEYHTGIGMCKLEG